MVLQSVSTCNNPIIQLHYYRKDLLWYFPNEWNFVSGGQQLTRLIHMLWYMYSLFARIYKVPRGHIAGVKPLSHSVGHPGYIWNCHRLNTGPNKESLAILWVCVSRFWAGVWSKPGSLDFVRLPPVGFSSHPIKRTRQNLGRVKTQVRVTKSTLTKTQHATAARWRKKKYLQN